MSEPESSRDYFFKVCSRCGTQLGEATKRRRLTWIPAVSHFGCPFCSSGYVEVFGVLIRLPLRATTSRARRSPARGL